MNEGIDIALMCAKLAASKDERASIAVHSVSVAYNVVQVARYRYVYCYGQKLLSDGMQVDMVQMRQYRQDMVKHTILAALDITSLFLAAVSSSQQSR